MKKNNISEDYITITDIEGNTSVHTSSVIVNISEVKVISFDFRAWYVQSINGALLIAQRKNG